jgi:hypothetical protein
MGLTLILVSEQALALELEPELELELGLRVALMAPMGLFSSGPVAFSATGQI